MNIELAKNGSLTGELKITLDSADYAANYENALKLYRKRVDIPGFRKGTVPASLVKQRFGKSILADEMNRMLQDAISNYITENKLELLGSPIPKEDGEVGDWDNPSTFNFVYELGFSPEFSLGLDKSKSFTKFVVDVNEELVNRQVKDQAKRHGKLSKPEVTEADDMIMADFHELNPDGSVKEGGITNKSSLFLEFIKDEATKNAFVGKKVGDVVTADPFQLNPDHEDLAKMLGVTHHDLHHLDSKFNLTITEIMRMEAAELNQELFDKLYEPGTVTSEDQMKERVKADLEQMFEKDSEWMFSRDFARQIVDMISIELPDEFLKRFIIMTNEKPIDPAQLEFEYPAYTSSLRWQLIENKIIKENEITVTVDDAMAYVKETMIERFKQYGLPADDERIEQLAKQTLSKQDEAKNVYDMLYERGVMKVVAANCTIKTEKVAYEDFRHKSQH
jgi:trigger factor